MLSLTQFSRWTLGAKHLLWLRLAFAAPCAAALGCNALFDIDEPVLVEEQQAGDDVDGDAAIRPPDASVGENECVLTSHCSVGEVCIFRVCSPPCADDIDCDVGARCLQTAEGFACVRNDAAHCSDHGDCPAGVRCRDGECRNSCDDDGDCLQTQRCEARICRGESEPPTSSVDASVPEDPDDPDAGGTETDAPCAANERGCVGDARRICNGVGEWSAPVACPYVCRRGGCTGECSPGETSCQDDSARSCHEDGEWQTTACPFTCERGECVDECTEGAVDCSNLTPRECVDGLWVDAAPCAFSCVNGECQGECQPNDEMCGDGDLFTCGSDALWGEREACPFVCDADRCVGECVPDTTQCFTAGVQETCDETGTWGSRLDCPFVCVGEACGGECSPGTTHCPDASSEQTCTELGQWDADRTCTLGCVGDACDEGCAEGETRCSADGTAVQSCADGVWQDEPCQFVCAGGSCGGECSPGTTQCLNDSTQQTCSAAGQWGSATTCQFACVTDVCGGECVPGTNQCSNASTRQTCSSTGIWGSNFTCPLGCTGTSCTGCPSPPSSCQGATNGNVCTSTTQYITCNTDMNGCVAASATQTCATGTCNGSPGVAVCSCPTPPAVCQGATSGNVCTSSNQYVTCSLNSYGCVVASAVQNCAMGTCSGSAGAAACGCPTPPAACQGATSGNVCQSSSSYVTCSSDGNGCVTASMTATCSAGLSCGGSPGSASCQCPTPPADCAGAGTVCRNGSLATCGYDVAGCLVTTSVNPCPNPQSCTGAFPDAVCTCPSVSECDEPDEMNGSYCLDSSRLVRCSVVASCQQATPVSCAINAFEQCEGDHPGALCQTAYGAYADGGDSGTLGAGLLFGVQVTISSTIVVRRIGVITRAASSKIRLAIYTHSAATGPTTWLASALPSGNLVAGRQEFVLNDPVTPVSLGAGTYWIVGVMEASTSVAQGASAPVRYKSVDPWNTPFPLAMTGMTGDNLAKVNFYLIGSP
jgi:hypothetical protein